MRLKDRVALITGAGGGIGEATALRFLEEGASVALVDIQTEKIEGLAQTIRSRGGKSFSQKIDVRDRTHVQEVIRKIIKEFGRLDILINNAGLNIAVVAKKMTEEEWNQLIDINLKGTFFFSQAVLEPMSGQRYGRIVNTASIWIDGHVGQAGYSASKAGVIGLTKTIAREFAQRGINVNAIAPGYVETPMTEALPEKVKEELKRLIPMERLGKPEDVAEAVLFLVSEESNYITGHVLNVNGGIYM